MRKILITGGAGYVGCQPADYLVQRGHDVTDLIWWRCIWISWKINCVRGDIRDYEKFNTTVKNHEIVIHLACILVSFEMDPKLGKSINLDAFEPMVKSSINNGYVGLYASSQVCMV